MQPDPRHMRHALQLAARGEGYVEPNPMVGSVVVRADEVVGEGWHARFGGAHAEVHALEAAGRAARGATLYVTLEPCCHQGKTPPCTEAILSAGIASVVVAMRDPFPAVAGRGIAQLQAAGLQVEVGCEQQAALRLNAPYLKRLQFRRPWIIAKWAMTLDGKLATRTGDSQWISSPASREVVHRLRGRVDAIMVGRETARRDDPLLTARPPGPRVATRIVVDSHAELSLESQLVRSAATVPVLVAVAEQADARRCAALTRAGCEVLHCAGEDHLRRLEDLLGQLGHRPWTNVLVEGGGRLMGSLMQLNELDEVHAFIAPKLIGGEQSITPISGPGLETIDQAWRLEQPVISTCDNDVYVRGIVARTGRSL